MDNYNPNVYNNNYYYGSPIKPSNPAGIVSFIFAMVAIVLLMCGCIICLIPYAGWLIYIIFSIIAFVLIVAGFILGLVGVNAKGRPKGLAIAGLIINTILLLIEIATIVIIILGAIGVAGVGVWSMFDMLNNYSNGINSYTY